MKAGVVYPQVELGGDAGAVKAFAQAARGSPVRWKACTSISIARENALLVKR
jgi:hypothetical protein